MILRVRKSSTKGTVKIPGSKSHTIRGLFFASLARGKSEIKNPLISGDAESAIETCKALGAEIQMLEEKYIIEGFDGKPSIPDDVINVGNSGTTLRFGTVTAALAEGYTVFTGDYQIRKRPLGALLRAVNNLGAQAVSTRYNDMAPVIVKGKIRGGVTDLDSVTSQYLSALLINAPLFEKDTEINITRLNEVPYVDITLWWLDKLGIKYENNNYKSFYIKGGQSYNATNTTIPGDFSSATFFAVQAAISGGEFTLENLDINDPQGDKEVFSILEDMGASVKVRGQSITIKGNGLKGREIDMNAIPDALPAMAVAGCFAEGVTRLVNVPQARLKETDRIKVMCEELNKMGADISELEDGLLVKRSNLKGCSLKGYDDHRIVMALSLAGLNAEGETTINTAESIKVTFPEYVELMRNSGADMEFVTEECKK